MADLFESNHLPVLRGGLHAVFAIGFELCAAQFLAQRRGASKGCGTRMGNNSLRSGNFGAGSILRIPLDGIAGPPLVLANTNVAALLDLGD